MYREVFVAVIEDVLVLTVHLTLPWRCQRYHVISHFRYVWKEMLDRK